MTTRQIKKILIANRGEIALRVLRTCHEMGIPVVTVYSEADRESLAVRLADEAVCIGPAPPAESYLDQDKIIAAAWACGADAIHPGYGFLSENPEFAARCEQEDIIFIGPSAESIRNMGDKLAARKTMADAGVPLIPGTMSPVASFEHLQVQADMIGFPVMIKAVGGGGGKGIKIVHNPEDLKEAYDRATGEAMTAVGNADVYLEKYFDTARHIEIQVLGDMHGNGVHLGERECSLQRRHQKVMEETPSPFVDKELRQEMGMTAVRAVEEIGYRSSGTFEFLVDDKKKFYFLEMNTRLQVEHTVTEMCTGIDLVKEQIRIAQGEPLGYKSEDVRARGWSIQARINSEDPDNNFAPSVGKITEINFPGGQNVRFDSLLYPGVEVTPYYDSMIGKLVVWADNRQLAITRLELALRQLQVQGVKTTIPLHQRILADVNFIEGDFHTNYLEKMIAEQSGQISGEKTKIALLAAVAFAHNGRGAGQLADISAVEGASATESNWLRSGRQALTRRL
ncbi:acetyl-CoA carboxylase biotin carboxylase subunit [Planctomycetota bacterium]